MSDKVLFTKEMAKEYTILIPEMCPIHFELVKNVLRNGGYKVELLNNSGPEIVQTGLKYVHNDTCYPAILVIGQMIDALNSGKYDVNKTALIITQTGGGCRASNYIFLLRKALKKAGLEQVPVISLNVAGLEMQSGFTLDLKAIQSLLASIVYGDMLMDLSNQCKAYELNHGDSMNTVRKWLNKIAEEFKNNHAYTLKDIKNNLKIITQDFAAIPLKKENKVKVGIVGEIYIKYSSLGNNNLEQLLDNENCEIKIPGVLGFGLYCLYNAIEDHKLYGGHLFRLFFIKLAYRYVLKLEQMMIDAIKENSDFVAPSPFNQLIVEASKVIGLGTKMGEGWLLTGEMMELNNSGFKNIICTQPFGCLPNHIVGKGMIRKIKEIDPTCNITPIDYDPSASSVNQENRIKLMLAIAKESLNSDTTKEGRA